MRRGFVALAVLGLVATLAPVMPAQGIVKGVYPESECTPGYDPEAPEGSPPTYVPVAGCKRIHFRYGPIHITSGDNLIVTAPAVLEKPSEPGFVTRFRPDLVRIVGSAVSQREQVPPIEEIHLHHAVWLSPGRFNWPWAATGEEKTVKEMPAGYGLEFSPNDTWLVNYMIHNQLQQPDNVWIVYDVDFVPMAAAKAAGIKPVYPVWLNVAGYNGANPSYNTMLGAGNGVECSFPKDNCGPYGPYLQDKQTVVQDNGIGWQMKVDNTTDNRGRRFGAGDAILGGAAATSATVVWAGGHVHPGGLRNDVQVWRDLDGDNKIAADGSELRHVFTSDARYFPKADGTPRPPVSWDVAMEVAKPDYRWEIKRGDTLILNSVYDTAHGTWYEGMGIVVLFVSKNDDSGPDPFNPAEGTIDPHNTMITHLELPESSNHGGANEKPVQLGRGISTPYVTIAGYQYWPGGIGIENQGVPEVPTDGYLTFVNLDAPAQIFHTVTACPLPCNGSTGLSYPLASYRASGGKIVEFDSLELGYGPSGQTAAANTATFTLDVAEKQLDPGDYAYFCRVHPNMRGYFRVV